MVGKHLRRFSVPRGLRVARQLRDFLAANSVLWRTLILSPSSGFLGVPVLGDKRCKSDGYCVTQTT
jgi:hypothetical protein